MNPRQRRLLNDYNDMVDLRDRSKGMLDFRVSNNYQHYVVTIDGIEALVGATKGIKRKYHVFTIDLPPEYPLRQPMTFEIVNPRSPANCVANEWYLQNIRNIRHILPKVQFPPPTEEEGLEIYDAAEGLEFYDEK